MHQAGEKCAKAAMILLVVGGAWAYTCAAAQQTDSLSILKALFDARNAHNADAAAAFFAEDATITNTNGHKTTGRENIKKIMEGDSAGNAQFVLGSPKIMGDRITFTDLTTRDVFRKLEVAPVRIEGEAIVQGGKIKSFIVYLPPDSIGKIEAACKTPKGDGISIGGLPCLEYIPRAKAHAESLRTW